MHELKNISHKITFDTKNNNHLEVHASNINHNQNNSNSKKNMSQDLPNIDNKNYSFIRSDNQKMFTTKEKSENSSKLQNIIEEKKRIKLKKKKSNSNLNLPVAIIQFSEDESEANPVVVDDIDIERIEHLNQIQKIVIASESDLKNKSFYDKKIIKTKINLVDKDKNLIMSNTNYNSNSSRIKNNNFLLTESKNDYKYHVKPKHAIIGKTNYSIEKLEPDFNFKSTQLNFDPLKIPKNNKYLFTPVLKYITL